MFQGFTDETFDFFIAIGFNNNRDFFHANHDWYLRAVREPCLALAADLSAAVEEVDDTLERRPRRVVSRINRDLRYSHDKTPYRDYLWLAFGHPGETSAASPGIYFEIRRDAACYGMGFYGENRLLMNGLRRNLISEPRRFLEKWLPLREEFPLTTRSYKRMKIPEALQPDLKDWYCARDFYVEKELRDFRLLKSPALADEISEGFRRLAPLYRYFRDLTPVPDEDTTRYEPAERV